MLRIYNTLTGKKEIFEPMNPPAVKMYACGITVSGDAHIGHAYQALIYDIIRKYLEKSGYDVTYARNYTDVDDKIIAKSKETGIPADRYAEMMIKRIDKVMRELKIDDPDIWLKATCNIGNIIDFTSALIEKGYAYPTPGGDVYFSVEKFSDYGKLSGRKLEDALNGVRVENDEEKKNPLDFALWKAAKEGEISWDSPWGKGRPGWHIECSAMNRAAFGDQIDIHGGGRDLIFPHHENEIAQTEAATGKPFVKTWMHCAHLRVNGEKMSKSLGNFFTLRDLIEKGWSGREIRYVLINAHYRSGLNFAFSALEDARKALARIDACVEAATDGEAPEWARKHLEDFTAAVNDDLNLPKAFAALFALVRDANGKGAAGTLGVFKRMDEVLGVIFFGKAEKAAVPAEVQKLLDERAAARAAKNWAESDRLRDAIAAAGWLVKDSREGQSVTKK